MLVLIIALVALIVSILVLLVHLYHYPIIKICGHSMHPTLKDGEFYIGLRFCGEPVVGKIYVFKPPYDNKKRVIKRLTSYDSDKGLCYFVGDNLSDSYDSRDYGFVPVENIVATLYRKVGN